LYRIQNGPRTVHPDESYWQLMKAFSLWSEVSPLTFQQVDDTQPVVDIDISFVSGYHNDGAPFDGQGRLIG